MVERRSPKPDVGGSSPSWPANSNPIVEGNKVTKAIEFLKDVKAELKKVTWPTRKETISSTYLVIIMVIVISAFLGLVDSILAWLVKEVLG